MKKLFLEKGILFFVLLQLACEGASFHGGNTRTIQSPAEVTPESEDAVPTVEDVIKTGKDVDVVPLACTLKITPNKIDIGESVEIKVTTTGTVETISVLGQSVPLETGTLTVTPDKTVSDYSAEVIGDLGQKVICSDTVEVSTIKTQELNIAANEENDPQYFLFIVDNSFSMADDIIKLKNSLSTLFTTLETKNIVYTAHIVGISDIKNHLSQTSTTDPAYIAEMRPTTSGYYPSSKIFSNGTALSTIQAHIEALQVGNLHDEMAVCTVMDYLSRMKTRFNEERDFHVVLLSDEDNSTSYRRFDAVGNLQGDRKLLCKYQSDNIRVPGDKYSMYYTFKEFKTTYKTFRYKIEYDRLSTCEVRGSANATEDQYTLESAEGCAIAGYNCKDKFRPYDYKCTKPSDGSDLIFLKQQVPANNEYCEAAKYFTCDVIIDGIASTKRFRRYQVQASWTCTPDWSDLEEIFIHKSYTSKPGIRKCAPCAVNSYTNVRIRENQRDTLLSGTTDKRYIQCDSTPYDAHAFKYWRTYSTTYSGTGNQRKLTSVSPTVCNADYHPYSQSTKRATANDICQFELNALTPLPSGLEARKTGVSEHDQRASYPTLYDGNYEATLLAQQKSMANVDPNSVTVVLDRINQYTDVISYTSLFRANHTARLQAGFSETSTDYIDVREDNAAFKARGNFSPKTQKKVMETNGVRTEYTWQTQLVVKGPTVDELLDRVATDYPNRKFFWHSIINIDGSPCPGQANNNLSEGVQYKDISQKTGGIISNICNVDFNSFMTEVSKAVTESKILEYAVTIPSGFQITEIKNITQSKVYSSPTDYVINGSKVAFTKELIEKADKILITYEVQ